MSPVAAFLVMALPAIIVAVAAGAVLLSTGSGGLLPAVIEEDDPEATA